MKRITFKRVFEFSDDTSDDEAVCSAIEQLGQTSYDDDDFEIEPGMPSIDEEEE